MRALAITVAVVCAGSAMAQDAPDWRTTVEDAGWTFVGEGEGIVSFARRHSEDPRLIAFRNEYRDGFFAATVPHLIERYPQYADARSVISVAEFDCDGRRRKAHEETLYSGRNLTGTALLRRAEDRPWLAIDPGTVGSQQFEWVCSQPPIRSR